MVATKNRKKLEEIKEILGKLDLRIISLADCEKPPVIVENGKTFRENAVKKAVKIARFTGKLTMGEDSGLCVNAIGGEPGVHSARFAGRSKSDENNNAKLLRLLDGLKLRERKAYYACAVALADKNGLIRVVEGRCNGVIDYSPKGDFGFGYDPIFRIPEYKKTFAQLGPVIKHKMSHRFKALEKVRAVLKKYIEKQNQS
ncbi:MAG: RdgB/HAM1 family non-canonical purine NTP pyrophosphatase [Candidatus Omnitrophica bacterium]|nr:RdgB/HAM1 family non-canonical purine NTP pyrophosphatase [Candidatus Omnitrophota bacterium]